MKNNKRILLLIAMAIVIVTAVIFLQKQTYTQSGEIRNFTPVSEKEGLYPHAVEISGGTGFVNTDGNISVSDLIGKKVILVDFWTYSCINCIRTIPYLNSWYEKYKDDGLEIIGIHSPEFSFERDYINVADAASRLGIKYPVVLDSNMSIWNAYHNQYWPAEYLIDIDGYVVDTHFGEGDYNTTEAKIRDLLAERDVRLNVSSNMPTTGVGINGIIGIIGINYSMVQSPETYFGAERNQYLANGYSGIIGSQNLSLPDKLQYNSLYLLGSWNFTSEYAYPLDNNSSILYGYSAKNVYVVLNASKGSSMSAVLDGSAAISVPIGPYGLYPIVNRSYYGVHSLQILNIPAGTQFYTFTFG